MTTQSWIMYLVLVLAATATPGPAVLLVMTNSTLYGKRKAIVSAIGNIIGLLCLGIISITWLGAIIKTSAFVFDIVKYIGAAYLIYIGLKLLFSKKSNFKNVLNNKTLKNVSSKKIFVQAFIVALSNPKAIVFLTALFPQFIDINSALVPQFTSLIVTLMFFSFSFLMMYAILAYRAKNWLTNPKRVKYVNNTSGSIFIFFGLVLASSSNK